MQPSPTPVDLPFAVAIATRREYETLVTALQTYLEWRSTSPAPHPTQSSGSPPLSPEEVRQFLQRIQTPPVMEVDLCWKEAKNDESGFRLVTPWSDPFVHEAPADLLFRTREDALKWKEENASEEEWEICQRILFPLSGPDPDNQGNPGFGKDNLSGSIPLPESVPLPLFHTAPTQPVGSQTEQTEVRHAFERFVDTRGIQYEVMDLYQEKGTWWTRLSLPPEHVREHRTFQVVRTEDGQIEFLET